MNNYTFALHTLGCKVNQYEGEKLVSELAGLGLSRVGYGEVAHVYIVNGCTVTSVANHKARQLIRRASRRNPEALIVVTGCYAEGAREEIERLPGNVIALGNDAKEEIAKEVAGRLSLAADAISSSSRIPYIAHARPVVKVQDGCASFCSYCIVPHVRPNLSSTPVDDVVAEVERLAEGGVAEIVLTGIHLGHYGVDLEPRRRLDDLLMALADIGPRIRMSSLEMREATPTMLDLMRDRPDAYCRHFHLPLQSGSDAVLEAMNRRYSGKEFLERCAQIKEAVPGVALTTDIIVGFPGETEADFERTLTVVEEVGFAKVHAFRYSPRPGTPAAEMPDQVSANVKEERLRTLIELSDRIAARFASSFVGECLSVVAESSERSGWVGTSDNYLRVHFEGTACRAGEAVEVRVQESRGTALYGNVVQKPLATGSSC